MVMPPLGKEPDGNILIFWEKNLADCVPGVARIPAGIGNTVLYRVVFL
jgi:hypothetical protein